MRLLFLDESGPARRALRSAESRSGPRTGRCCASASLGLQAADLVVATALAARRNQGDASRWHKQLLPRFARHPDTGALEGVGIVEFPGRQRGEPIPAAKLFVS